MKYLILFTVLTISTGTVRAENIEKVKIHISRFKCEGFTTSILLEDLITNSSHNQRLQTSPKYQGFQNCSQDLLDLAKNYADFDGYLYGQFIEKISHVYETKCYGGGRWGVCWDLPVIFKKTQYFLDIDPFSLMIQLKDNYEYESGCSNDSRSHPCSFKGEN